MAKNKCDECYRSFDTMHGLRIHKTRMHPYVPPPPPPPKKEFVSYKELVVDLNLEGITTWGRQMTDYEREHPGREELKLGYLAAILAELRKITKHLK